MNKENLAFLVGGLAFGFLIGFGTYNAVSTAPAVEGAALGATQAAPAGPPARIPSSPDGGGGAPMMAEINRLKTVLQSSPTDFQALVRLGNLHYDVQMWDQAVTYYVRAVEVEPGNADVMTDLGVCYRNLGQLEQALITFNAASAADPNHFPSLFNIVVVAGLDLGRFDLADQALQALEAMDPPPPRVDELRTALEESRATRGGTS